MLRVSDWLPAGLDLSGRIETEQQNDQNEYDWRYAHSFLHHRQKIAKASMARRTPSNGLETAKQKEKSQPESCAIGFVFMVSSKAFEDRHFKKHEIFCVMRWRSDAAMIFARANFVNVLTASHRDG
jgi:hypothetical protein